MIDYDSLFNEYDCLNAIRDKFLDRDVMSFLSEQCFLPVERSVYSGKMGKYVFLHGDLNEVYSKFEIEYIEKIECIHVFSDYYFQKQQGRVSCRVIAARIYDKGTACITSCLKFEKIIDKAIDGFNIFFFVSDDAVYFGCRLFEVTDGCILTLPIKKVEQMQSFMEDMYYISYENGFIDYYIQIRDAIDSLTEVQKSVNKVIESQTSILDHLDILSKLEGEFNVDLSHLKWMRFEFIYGSYNEEKTIDELYKECQDELLFIHSTKMNTIEMIFEAEEILRLAEEAERQREEIITETFNKWNNEQHDSEAESLLDNPEEVIKLLKNRRGL